MLEQLIAEKGWIPFADFMQQALYAPGLGYYSAGLTKLGPTGDFVTAPEISALFSYSLANQCKEILCFLNAGSILEFGAGSGRMANDILAFLATQQCLPEHYFILEVSADLRDRQQSYLKTHCPHYEKIVWLDSLPKAPFNGIILANEVMDAMPVERFQIGEQGILQEQVGKVEGEWRSRFIPTSDVRFNKSVSDLLEEVPLPVGYTSEINLNLGPWIKSLSECLMQGVMLLIDYGFPRHEFYHPSRHMGTLMCHYRHKAHPDPLINIGLQDITAHVDFTAVAVAAVENNLEVMGFTTQGAFLIANGLLELAQEIKSDPNLISQQIQQLTQPHEMGELFKVIALGKDFPSSLQGFQLIDHLHRL